MINKLNPYYCIMKTCFLNWPKPIYFLLILILTACGTKNSSNDEVGETKVFHNAKFYNPDSPLDTITYVEIRNGKISALGKWEDYQKQEGTVAINLKGQFVYPGFIDAHCHFYHYGLGLNELNLKGCKSFEEVIERVKEHAVSNPNGWIEGRGWDHTTWQVKVFPNNQVFDSLFPDRPVLLKRIDGHAALANTAALTQANINVETQIAGGELLINDGKLTGILIDNAVDRVFEAIPPPSREQQISGILKAQENCFKAGLTTVVCAGLDIDVILLMDSLHKSKDLKMKVYAMLNPKKINFDWVKARNGKPFKTKKLHVRSFKLYADGSLGSRGALLKEAYCDKTGHFGLPVLSYYQLDSFTNLIKNMGYQVNTHCIGDSANSMMLNLYGKYLGGKNKERWRIEHAQVIDTQDFDLFTKYSILPSVQPTHATSDMRWAHERLCSSRMVGAYAYRKLLETNGILPLGTDFPVENIYPLETYYAAVFRSKNGSKAFQVQDALTPEEAILGMTTWAAYSCFEEKEKGSFAIGKWADFVVLNNSLEESSESNFTSLDVMGTFIDGNRVTD